VHGASAEDVDVEMVDGLTAVVAGVEHEAEAVGEFAFGERCGFFEQVAEDVGRSFGHVSEVALGDEQPVSGGLRVDVGEGERVVVFMDGFDWDLVIGDLAEETVWHG
jgi:hypothetical protein